MIKDNLNSHKMHELIEGFCCESFEDSVRFPRASDTVYDLIATIIRLNHTGNRVDIILKICIHCDGDITILFYGHKSCKHCILMSDVVGKVNSAKAKRILLMQCTDDTPCLILGAIIHKNNTTVFRDKLLIDHVIELS